MPGFCFGNYRFDTTLIRFILFLVGFFLLLGLGMWQLQRADEKKAMLLTHQKRAQQPPTNWTEHSPAPQQYERIRVAGTYISTQFLLDNQFFQHQFGYHVLSVLRLDDGEGYLLVDRGFMKGDPLRQKLPTDNLVLPEGRQVLEGYAYYPSYNRWIKQLAIQGNQPIIVIEQFLPKVLREYLHSFVFDFIIRLEKPTSQTFITNWQIVAMPPARHTAYAVQWFAFAVLWIIIFIGIQLKRETERG